MPTVFLNQGILATPLPYSPPIPPPPPPPSSLLASIKALVGTGKVLLGQHTNYFDPLPLGNWTPLQGATGQTPAIMGLTPSNGGNGGVPFSNESNPSDGTYYAPIMANNFLALGGIVILNYWLGNPSNGVMINGDVTVINNPTADITAMLTTGTSQHNNWVTCKNTMISQINQCNGVVIVRPFFEMEGNWFWFGSASSSAYISMWQDMVTTIRAGTNKALFFWCSNGGGFNYWPGSAYVDICGYDSYPAGGAPGAYASLLGTGCPIFVGECGVIGATNPATFTGDNSVMLSNTLAATPQGVGYNVFCQNWSMTTQNGENATMNNTHAITLSKLAANGF